MGANEVAAVFEELFESVCFQRFVVVEVVRRERGEKVVHTQQTVVSLNVVYFSNS